MSEELVLVDLFDKEIGYGEKMEVHRKGQLHRAFSVFFMNGGKIFLQRRAMNKYHSAGLWANACCSHYRRGEDVKETIKRRLEEELGIPYGKCDPLEYTSFLYYTPYDGVSEYEFDHVFVSDYQGEVHPNPEEVMETRWVTYEELKKEMEESPENFATWFIIAAQNLLRMYMATIV